MDISAVNTLSLLLLKSNIFAWVVQVNGWQVCSNETLGSLETDL